MLADTNPDLINLYNHLIAEGDTFIAYCRKLFTKTNNDKSRFYAYRKKFNTTQDSRRKSALFLYLNRHCYNGLVRYNSEGKFNTPFGRYVKPYFPKKEMEHFILASENATFMHANFQESMQQAKRGDVIYCDPPYVPLNKTAYFTDYHVGGFSWEDQVNLAKIAQRLSGKGVQVVISNHNTREIRQLYKEANATINKFSVRRTISRDTNNRAKVSELIAVFN